MSNKSLVMSNRKAYEVRVFLHSKMTSEQVVSLLLEEIPEMVKSVAWKIVCEMSDEKSALVFVGSPAEAGMVAGKLEFFGFRVTSNAI